MTCLNDGRAPAFETNFFSTYDACCEFSWMDTQKCQQNKPGFQKWYPTSDSFCTNEGHPPKHIALSNSIEKCCFRFFLASQEECIYKSHNPNHGVSSCHSFYKKRQCRQENSCIWNETSNTCSTSTITESDACASLKKKLCKQKKSCLWNETTDSCSASFTGAHPFSKPSNQPIISGGESTNCQALNSKRKCRTNESCSWNDVAGICLLRTTV